MNKEYKEKYLKYKIKYLDKSLNNESQNTKNLKGGGDDNKLEVLFLYNEGGGTRRGRGKVIRKDPVESVHSSVPDTPPSSQGDSIVSEDSSQFKYEIGQLSKFIINRGWKKDNLKIEEFNSSIDNILAESQNTLNQEYKDIPDHLKKFTFELSEEGKNEECQRQHNIQLELALQEMKGNRSDVFKLELINQEEIEKIKNYKNLIDSTNIYNYITFVEVNECVIQFKKENKFNIALKFITEIKIGDVVNFPNPESIGNPEEHIGIVSKVFLCEVEVIYRTRQRGVLEIATVNKSDVKKTKKENENNFLKNLNDGIRDHPETDENIKKFIETQMSYLQRYPTISHAPNRG